MSEGFRYELTLTVRDCGDRTFSARSDCDTQTEMGRDLSYDIGRMLTIMNDPPELTQIAADVEERRKGEGVFDLLHRLHKAWDAENDFEDALTLTVDLKILASSNDQNVMAVLVSLLTSQYGRMIRFVNAPPPMN